MARIVSTRKCHVLVIGDLEYVIIFPRRVLTKLGVHCLEPGDMDTVSPGERDYSGLVGGRIWVILETVNLILGQPQPLVVDADMVFVDRVKCQGKPEGTIMDWFETKNRTNDMLHGLISFV